MTRTRARSGFAIPAAIVVLVAVAMIAATTQWASWRAVRASRLAWDGDRALFATDEALAQALAAWNASDFAQRDLGATWTRTFTTADNASATATFTRSAPLALHVALQSSSARAGPHTARRSLDATVPLAVPVPPLIAAVTSAAPLDASPAIIDGADRTTDACGSTHDTLGVTPVAINPTLVSAITAFADSVATRANTIEVATTPLGASPTTWSLRVVRPDSSAPTPIAIATNVTHQGMLVVLGDLHITGTLKIDGLLVVTGALVVHGALQIDGAILVNGTPTNATIPSALNIATTVRYSRCSALRALATVSRPSRAIDWRER